MAILFQYLNAMTIQILILVPWASIVWSQISVYALPTG
jgi:hypothetical protein